MKSHCQVVLEQILFQGLIRHDSYSQILGFARKRQDKTREKTILDLGQGESPSNIDMAIS